METDDSFYCDEVELDEIFFDDMELLDSAEGTIINLNLCDQPIQSKYTEYVIETNKDLVEKPQEQDKATKKRKSAESKTTPLKPQKKSKSKFREFSSEEKKILAGLIEKEPHIWDLNHKLHSNIYAITSSWQKITRSFTDCKESDCKAVWRSLKSSERYFRSKNSKKGNTGDSADEECFPESEDWEFSECMSFMKPMSQKYPRQTTVLGISDENDGNAAFATSSATITNHSEPMVTNDPTDANHTITEDPHGEYSEVPRAASVVNQIPDDADSEYSDASFINNEITECSDASSNSKGGSNYDYATQSKKKDMLTASVVSITKGISELVSCRKIEMQNKQREQCDQTENRLQFGYMWGNFDPLLQMLPPADVFDLNLKFLELINEKLKKIV